MLELEHVSWALPDGTEILNDISLTVGTGRMAVITGPNGGGKTSLAKIIAGIENRIPDGFCWTEKTLPIWTLRSGRSLGWRMRFNSRYGLRD